MDSLKKKWIQYGQNKVFNYEVVQKRVSGIYPAISFKPNDSIVIRGEFPKYIYFIISGVAMGIRDYTNGNEYDYFRLDKSNGSVGLLEVLAQKEEMIATVVCLSEVQAIRVPSAVVFEWVMQDLELLRLSTYLLADDLYDRSGNDGLFYQFEGVDRLRYFLVAYYEEHCDAHHMLVEIKESREKIANRLGMSLRTVGRSLKKLKENKEIINEQRKTYIGVEEHKRLKTKLAQL